MGERSLINKVYHCPEVIVDIMSLCIVCADTLRALPDELEKVGTSRNVSLFVNVEVEAAQLSGSTLLRAQAHPGDRLRSLIAWE